MAMHRCELSDDEAPRAVLFLDLDANGGLVAGTWCCGVVWPDDGDNRYPFVLLADGRLDYGADVKKPEINRYQETSGWHDSPIRVGGTITVRDHEGEEVLKWTRVERA